MKATGAIVGRLLWGGISVLACCVLLVFTVRLTHAIWTDTPDLPHLTVGGLPLVIGSIAVLGVAVDLARDRFINVLAAAIGKRMPNPADYV